MSLERMPTAIACQEDGIAVPLIFQLERSGYEVPNDISVIGYDNSFYANDIGLTTIAQDPIEMAKMAAEMTVKLIEGEARASVPHDSGGTCRAFEHRQARRLTLRNTPPLTHRE